MDLIEKSRRVEREIARNWGGFSLFGLFEREQTAGKWDVLVSAPWLRTDRTGIQLIVSGFISELSQEDWLMIAGVVPLSSSSPYVQWIAQRFNVEHGREEVSNTVFDGVYINRAVIITANPQPIQIRELQTFVA